MTTKHTPGPWKVHKTNQARSGLPEFEIHWPADGECVAEIVHGEADALLIAAAPDLLAALEAIKLDCDPNSRIGVRARAAIAKATGEPA